MHGVHRCVTHTATTLPRQLPRTWLPRANNCCKDSMAPISIFCRLLPYFWGTPCSPNIAAR